MEYIIKKGKKIEATKEILLEVVYETLDRWKIFEQIRSTYPEGTTKKKILADMLEKNPHMITDYLTKIKNIYIDHPVIKNQHYILMIKSQQ